jgi:hypothetical protein
VIVEDQMIDGFRVAITRNNDVPKFGPALPNPPVFTDMTKLHNFLMAKSIHSLT